jgi:hypothetical protein
LVLPRAGLAGGILDTYVDNPEEVAQGYSTTTAKKDAISRAENIGGIVVSLPVTYRYDMEDGE